MVCSRDVEKIGGLAIKAVLGGCRNISPYGSM